MELGLEAICQHYAQLKLQMVQVLLDPADETTIDIYTRHSFARIAELIYLQRNVRRTPPPMPLSTEYEQLNYSEKTHPMFAAAVLASYQHSLDCPALNGLRDIEDILAGHKGAGLFDPNDWFLIRHKRDTDCGVMLSITHQADGMELVYLGLAPKARGRGIGNYLMQIALARVYEKKLHKLTLAVDSVNEPALKLYHRHGLAGDCQQDGDDADAGEITNYEIISEISFFVISAHPSAVDSTNSTQFPAGSWHSKL